MLQQANAIASLGGIAVKGGDLAITDAVALTVDSTVSAANVALRDTANGIAIRVPGTINSTVRTTLTATQGNIALSGNINATSTGTVELNAASGGILQSGGSIVAGSLTSLIGVGGNVLLDRASNRIGTIGQFLVNAGDLRLTDSIALTQTGTLSATNVSLTGNAAGTAITLNGVLSGAGSVLLNTPFGGVSQAPSASIVTPILSSTGIGGAVDLAGTANRIAAITNLPAGSNAVAVVDAAALTVNGSITGSKVSLTDTASGTAITLNGVISASTSVALITTNGGITEASTAVITTPVLSVAASVGSVLLQGAANNIATLADATLGTGDFVLTDAAALILSGRLTTSAGGVTLNDTAVGTAINSAGLITSSGTVTMNAGNGASVAGSEAARPAILTSNGTITAPVLVLNSSNAGVLQAVSQTGGVIRAGVTGTAASGDVSLNNGANQIGTLGSFNVSGGNLTLVTATSLTVDTLLHGGGAAVGSVQAKNIGLTTRVSDGGPVGLDLRIAGNVGTTGTLTTIVDGTILRTSGELAADTLTGSAVRLANFGLASRIGTLGRFTVVGSEFVLDNAVPLTITGPVSSDFMRISAVGRMTLAGSILTFGQPRAENSGEVAALLGSTLRVHPDATGAALFEQTGRSFIGPSKGRLATVRIELPPSGGKVTFNDLFAPNADLILFTRTGRATGVVNLDGLTVVGQSGGTDLTGSVAGLEGQAAASKSKIAPSSNTSYRFNSCPIASINCVLLPPGSVPPAVPLRDLSIGTGQNNQDDEDVLPNVSDEDY